MKMTKLHATPHSLDDYLAKWEKPLDRFGNFVEEFKIQFISGDDAELFEAFAINQANLNISFDKLSFCMTLKRLAFTIWLVRLFMTFSKH